MTLFIVFALAVATLVLACVVLNIDNDLINLRDEFDQMSDKLKEFEEQTCW